MTRLASVEHFASQVALVAQTFKWYPGKADELDAIASALATDETTRDITLETPVPLGEGGVSRAGGTNNSPFTNAILLLVNRGKGSNLTATEMSDVLTGGVSLVRPPEMTSPPMVSAQGTILSCTMGNWKYVPTAYEYQWLSGGVQIEGASESTYDASANSGETLSCLLTATNAAGSTNALSNEVTVA